MVSRVAFYSFLVSMCRFDVRARCHGDRAALMSEAADVSPPPDVLTNQRDSKHQHPEGKRGRGGHVRETRDLLWDIASNNITTLSDWRVWGGGPVCEGSPSRRSNQRSPSPRRWPPAPSGTETQSVSLYGTGCFMLIRILVDSFHRYFIIKEEGSDYMIQRRDFRSNSCGSLLAAHFNKIFICVEYFQNVRLPRSDWEEHFSSSCRLWKLSNRLWHLIIYITGVAEGSCERIIIIIIRGCDPLLKDEQSGRRQRQWSKMSKIQTKLFVKLSKGHVNTHNIYIYVWYVYCLRLTMPKRRASVS